MSAIVGGTASALGGGKFANGAVSAAFVMMYNEWAHTYPQKNQLKTLSLSRWKYGQNGRYKTWLIGGVDTGNRTYAPFEYYNGRSPAERFVDGVGGFIVEHPDGIGLALSLGAIASSGGMSWLFGLSALTLDTISGDKYGAGFGIPALANIRGAGIVDLSYGVCRTNETCSNFLDNTLP
jgi:hypothetical protein